MQTSSCVCLILKKCIYLLDTTHFINYLYTAKPIKTHIGIANNTCQMILPPNDKEINYAIGIWTQPIIEKNNQHKFQVRPEATLGNA